MRPRTVRMMVSPNRLLWGAVFFAGFLFGADMCATMSRTGAHFSVWAMVAVVTIAGATGTGWLAGMPAREASSHPATATSTPTIIGEFSGDWSQFEDGWVEV